MAGHPKKSEAEIEIEVVDADWDDRESGNSGTHAIPRMHDSTPPGEVTNLSDLKGIAKMLDMSAVPRRRVQTVTFPLPPEAWKIFLLVDGERSVETILQDASMSESEVMHGLQLLLQSGVLTFR